MIVKNFKKIVLVFISLILSGVLYAQKDVTQFLGIPVDGSKSEMIQKLKSKGYTNSPFKEDVLVGEFNGTDVNIFIVTNNNKVWRIGLADVNTKNKEDIKIRFNNLLQQFQNNKKYLSLPDSTISKLTISEDEDISYEILVNKKQYKASFFQKTADYDSLTLESDSLLAKQSKNDTDIERLIMLTGKITEELFKCFNKTVMLNISERSGEYYILIIYSNDYNKANGEDL